MLYTVIVTSDASVRKTCMSCFARFGASLPFGTAIGTNSAASRSMKSCCRLRNDSQRGCCSSMIEISTRSIIGSRRPLKRAASACPSASSAFGSAS